MDDGCVAEAGHPAPQAPRRWPRPPRGFLGMLALIVAVEAMISARDLDFTDVWHWDWRIFGKAVAAKGKGKDLLFFGDSLVKFGVMPKVIRDRSDLTSFNFAIHVGQTSTSYFMLRRALDGGARPKAVVVDISPHPLRIGPDEKGNLWGELLRPSEAFDLAWTMDRDAEFFARTIVAGYLPSYREREEIRKNIQFALRGESWSKRRYLAQFFRNWKVNQGAQLMGESPAPEIDSVKWAAYHFAGWKPHPVNLAYLDRLLGLARSNHIPVYWYIPPFHPGVQEANEASGFDAEYTRFVQGVRSRFPEVAVIDARKVGMSADMFTDGVHPNRRGALRLSAALGDLLRDREAVMRKGWVALDASSRPFDRPIEDVILSDFKTREAVDTTVRR